MSIINIIRMKQIKINLNKEKKNEIKQKRNYIK